MKHLDFLVPDTSVIIEGIVSKKLQSELKPGRILIHEALLSELEHQANSKREIGFLGMEELERIKKIAAEKGIAVEFSGMKPTSHQISMASLGEIDGMIRDLAYEKGAVLITADRTQAKVARIKGIEVIEAVPKKAEKQIMLEQFFDETTMSAHLREGMPAFAKKGFPGNWKYVKVRDEALTAKEIQEISREIIEQTALRTDAFIEIDRPGSTIIQFGNFRIVVTKPPFSDGWEITAVRPVKLLELEEYHLPDKLSKRIKEQAEGILIAGAPGQGKTTFARALAIYYSNQEKVVKTVEAPRDLILPDSITQLAISYGSAEEVHDILLLTRPDYTIFDEMRNTDDFKLFADLRLSGVGMVGIVHATNPIDAIQRFIGRIDLGVIPQIIDTVIFIKGGTIAKLYEVKMTVKVPAGMTEADLARPVVTVCDIITSEIEYEIYSYGEETVVIPVAMVKEAGGAAASPANKLAAESLVEKFKKYAEDVRVEVTASDRCTVYVPESEIGAIIGKGGKRIEQIEKDLGIHIDVKELPETEGGKPAAEARHLGENIEYEIESKKRYVAFHFREEMTGREMDIYVDGEFLLSAKVGSKNIIKVHKFSDFGKDLVKAITQKRSIELKG